MTPTTDQIKEAIAKAISDALHASPKHSDAASAVMALVGPKPLVWVPDGNFHCVWDCVNTDDNQYRLMHDDISNEHAALIDGVWAWRNTQSLAQAAAQSHADAAHWSGMVLADMIGGK